MAAQGSIGLTPDQMRGRAGEFTNAASTLNDVITKMDGLLNNLQEEWQGESSKSFKTKFDELRPGFVKAKDLIDEISNSLKKTADDFEEFDRSHQY